MFVEGEGSRMRSRGRSVEGDGCKSLANAGLGHHAYLLGLCATRTRGRSTCVVHAELEMSVCRED